MKSARDAEEEQRFYDGLAAYLQSTERERLDKTYHVSDLLSPRLAYFKRTDPKPLTRAQLGYFLAGQAHHIIAEIVLKGDDGVSEESITLEVGDHKVIGTPDVMRNTPHEFKTNRRATIPKEPNQEYVDQLQMYCAMRGQNSGKIVVFFLCPKRRADNSKQTTPELAVWNVEFEEEELRQARKWLGDCALNLTKALKTNDHTALPLCEEWKCGWGARGKEPAKINCEWYEQCQPQGRYPASRLGR
jgi:hypothetical protein